MGLERSNSVGLSPVWTTLNSDCYSKTWRSLNVCLCALTSSSKKYSWSIAEPRKLQATHKCAHHWGIHKICVNRVAAPSLQSRSHSQIFTCLPLWKTACEKTVLRMSRHWRIPRAGGLRGERATFIGWEYMPLSKDGRRLLTKMGTAVKSNYTFSSVFVKCSEIFIV